MVMAIVVTTRAQMPIFQFLVLRAAQRIKFSLMVARQVDRVDDLPVAIVGHLLSGGALGR
jgi:hypothetical protein